MNNYHLFYKCNVTLSIIAFIIVYESNLSARTIIVDQTGAGDYLTIQEGVNLANDGDVVLVFPGIYRESVKIEEKKLHLLVLVLNQQGFMQRVEVQSC